MVRSHRHPDRIVAEVAERGLSLELSTLDLCFVVALHIRATSAQLASFTEDQLEDVFARVCDAVAGDGEAAGKRATAAIARLRNQRMLTRIDGLGVVKAPEYGLTRLATAIVDYVLEDEILTPESLTVLTRSLAASLRDVRDASQGADSAEAWESSVVEPLRVTVSDLVGGIERRQRGLDQQQESFQDQIRSLLDADWFGAIDHCQQLLETTSETLRELGELLLRDTHQLQELLADIQERALAAGAEAAVAAAHRVVDQLDRIVGWGAARQQAWSEYFQYVHRFLRDVVRLDPTRALTQRLRDQLAGTAGRSFTLTIAAGPPIQLLRDVTPPPEDQPPVSRPRKTRDREPRGEEARDPQAELDARVSDTLARGAGTLAAVTRSLAGDVADEDRFVAAGRVAHTVARLARPRAARERPWVRVDDVTLEDWDIPRDDAAESGA